ncbi:Chemotaxis protein CheV [Piscirickettsia salmonis]|uniref:Response regulator n=1 Tax=Piscirickettsia salmonis TaxID=1238 RepID=A0A1L6TD34_PISSA|nr:chemotaxis protein [Piscirickettsia salmonis]AKP74355.1 chemotaxis protein CheW [Piscirickettsia salmonis LF-89 = ATCC VR-1361]ALB23299.1 response regulator [Piscirickettsia salmonis]ALY03204.1 chemotaxis protein CheW [Piscirickettsia salmonis]AMA42767.1 chemotaxis protein CheW [Piscirickettsia salmonis]AOS35239.1 chemotaxis protein CheW [Piscirickettsia salmonis]
MAGILDTVDARTQLVGKNRLESLLFKLGDENIYAMNVFKIREVLQQQPLTILPNSHQCVLGVMHMRGQTIPIIDLSKEIGMKSLADDDSAVIVISEYYGYTQGFLVSSVERIINIEWNEIKQPPSGLGNSHYVTATLNFERKIVQVVDVEKVLADIIGFEAHTDDIEIDKSLDLSSVSLLIVDDSSFARNHLIKILSKLDINVVACNSGADAFAYLKKVANEESDADISKKIPVVITDAEMPEMDGYTLTVKCREDPKLKDLFIVLHTSLSGEFNKAMVEHVGCNDFIAKFDPTKTLHIIQERLKALFF